MKPTAISLSQNSPLVVTKSAGTAGAMSDIFVIQVPPTAMLELKPSDFVYGYFKDASAESWQPMKSRL
jgi:hypothetical protein